VTVAGPTDVVEVTPAAVREFVWKPEDFGIEPTLARHRPRRFAGGQVPALIPQRARRRARSRPRVVIANAAAAIWIARPHDDHPRHKPPWPAKRSTPGAARELLAKLVKKTNV